MKLESSLLDSSHENNWLYNWAFYYFLPIGCDKKSSETTGSLDQRRKCVLFFYSDLKLFWFLLQPLFSEWKWISESSGAHTHTYRLRTVCPVSHPFFLLFILPPSYLSLYVDPLYFSFILLSPYYQRHIHTHTAHRYRNDPEIYVRIENKNQILAIFNSSKLQYFMLCLLTLNFVSEVWRARKLTGRKLIDSLEGWPRIRNRP